MTSAQPAPAKQLQPQSLAAQAFDRLQQRIVDGLIEPGSRLVIDQLAKEFGVSLIPVREALVRLHAIRLVEYNPHKGYRVARRLSAIDLKELFDARLMLESAVMVFVVKSADRSLVSDLRKINARIASCKTGATFANFRRFIELNDEFHTRLIESAGNRLILEAYRGLSYGPQVARELFGRGVADQSEIVEEHEHIVNAIERKDIDEAIRSVRKHILDGFDRFSAETTVAL